MTENELYTKAIKYIQKGGFVTIPSLQREFEISYADTARLIEKLETEKIIAPNEDSRGNKIVLIKTVPKIYLDIDGTLIHEEGRKAGEPAEGLEVFLLGLRRYDVYWLTTHCMEGDPIHARKLMKTCVSEMLHSDIDRIKPTQWKEQKTEAIDFSGPFMWFDNHPSLEEVEALKDCPPYQRLELVNLVINPYHLLETSKNIL